MKEKYVKSLLNYVGGKFKLLKEILPLFPDKIDTFVDLFGGGFNVGINVNAEQIDKKLKKLKLKNNLPDDVILKLEPKKMKN